MFGNINKLDKELKKKKVNIYRGYNHIINKETKNSYKCVKNVYGELKIFDKACFEDFLNYEKWLEGCFCGDKKR